MKTSDVEQNFGEDSFDIELSICKDKNLHCKQQLL